MTGGKMMVVMMVMERSPSDLHQIKSPLLRRHSGGSLEVAAAEAMEAMVAATALAVRVTTRHRLRGQNNNKRNRRSSYAPFICKEWVLIKKNNKKITCPTLGYSYSAAFTSPNLYSSYSSPFFPHPSSPVLTPMPPPTPTPTPTPLLACIQRSGSQ